MALTKVSGPLLHGSNDNLGNYVINNITGAAATFTGNVSVGGTLTYDDVTNVESVGLITAKSGIHVTGGSVRIGDNLSYTAAAAADNLVIGATTGQHGMTILTGNNSSSINFADSASTNPGAIKYNHNGTQYMGFRVAGGEKVRILQAGEVGIGTTNPYTTGAASKHKLTVAADDVLGIGRANTDMFYVRREYEAGKYSFQTINGGNAGNFNFQPFGGVVGIGTKTPATKLHVTTTSASSTPLTLERTHNNNVIVHYKNPTLSMYAGLAGEGLGWGVGDSPDLGNTGNNQLMVTSAGRIGIGTIAPETNLTIAVNATNQTTATIPTVRLTNLDTTAVASDIVGSYEFFSKDTHSLNKVTGFMRNTPTDAGVNYDLIFGTIQTSDSNAVERVRITSSGQVGIGTEAGYGDAKLTVEGTAALTNNDTTLQIKDNVNDSAAGRGGNIGFSGYVNGTQRTFAGIGGLKSVSGTGNFAGDLALYTRVNGQSELDERLRITSDGDVGIGRTDPAVKLDVKAAAGGGALRLRESSAQYRYLDFDVTGALTSITARSNNSHGNISIGTTDQFGRTNQLYIKGGSTASVGIGTDDPDSNLEIFKGSTGTYLKMGGDNASNGRALTFTSSTGDTGSNGALHTISATSGNGAIALDTAGTERLLVNNVGHTRIRRTVGLDLDNLPVGLNTATNYTLHISNNTNANSKSNGICFGLSSGDGIGAAIVHTRTGSNSYGTLMFATKPNGGDVTERLTIESDGNVTVQGGELGISTFTTNTSVLTFKNSVKDHKIGGVTVELADNTISPDIQVPGARHGCILFIFSHSDASGTYPQPGGVGMVYVDVGASTNIRPMYTQSGTGADDTPNVGNLIVGKNSHETDINNCDDGKLTVMKGSANGRLKLANRLDNSTYIFYLTMV